MHARFKSNKESQPQNIETFGDLMYWTMNMIDAISVHIYF